MWKWLGIYGFEGWWVYPPTSEELAAQETLLNLAQKSLEQAQMTTEYLEVDYMGLLSPLTRDTAPGSWLRKWQTR
jgi:hypothetical protein